MSKTIFLDFAADKKIRFPMRKTDLTIFYTKKMLCLDDGVSILRNSLLCKDATELLYSQFY
jgi:hypothetical protein